jgi:hypothetical protein
MNNKPGGSCVRLSRHNVHILIFTSTRPGSQDKIGERSVDPAGDSQECEV